MKLIKFLCLVIIIPVFLFAGELYFIDAHSQIDHKAKGLKQVLKRMRENNVRTTLLTTRGKRDWHEIIDWSKEYPDEIVPIMRTKGGDYMHNESKFLKRMNHEDSYNEFRGISETLLYHAQKGNKAPEMAVELDDSRFKTILNMDLKHDWPVVLHIEFASLHGEDKTRYMTKMKKLLNKYPNHPFLLIHMGQLRFNEAKPLLEEFSNLYFITSHCDPVTVESSSQPWTNLFVGNKFKKEWKELMEKYPKRFVFALDNVWASHWKKSYSQNIDYWKSALSDLDEKTANQIAHKNAQRLWKLDK